MTTVVLREVTRDDWPILYEHQRDPAANEMAAFPARDWEAFVELRGRVEVDPAVISRTIEADGVVVGTIGTFVIERERLVGYWLGREFWGRGIATEALRAILDLDPARPLGAEVAEHNLGSIKVLERCGFQRVGLKHEGDVDLFVMRLEATV